MSNLIHVFSCHDVINKMSKERNISHLKFKIFLTIFSFALIHFSLLLYHNKSDTESIRSPIPAFPQLSNEKYDNSRPFISCFGAVIHITAAEPSKSELIVFWTARNPLFLHHSKFKCLISNSNISSTYDATAYIAFQQKISDADGIFFGALVCQMVIDADDAKLLSLSSNTLLASLHLNGEMNCTISVPWRTRWMNTFWTLHSTRLEASQYSSKYYSDNNYVVNLVVDTLHHLPQFRSLSLYLEFIQHHLLLGIRHIYLLTPFEEDSLELSRLLQILRPYIEEGSVSIGTQSFSSMINHIASVYGIYWNRNVLKLMQINMCLYLSKGVADYVGVWDLDEFFIPKLPHNNIIDVIKAFGPIKQKSDQRYKRSNQRSALLFPTQHVRFLSSPRASQFSWLGGDRQQISILDISSALLIPSKLLPAVNSLVRNERSLVQSLNLELNDIGHTPEESSSAVMFHFIINQNISDHLFENKLFTSEYTKRFFPRVISELTRRGLDMVVTLPIRTLKLPPDATNWTNYEQVYHNAMKHRYQLLDEFQSLDTYPGASSIAELPAMTADLSELVLGSLLERSFDDDNLTLTTFMLGHEMLNSDLVGLGARMVRNDLIHMWEMAIAKWEGTLYTSSGQRVTPPDYYCRISNSNSSHRSMTYVVKGAFIPNRLTPDPNANRLLDILRCPMHGSQAQYKDLIRSDEHLLVEILRERDSLINFTVPWRSRKTGLMLSLPPQASMFDSWQGYGESSPSNSTKLTVHMCTPGMETPPGRRILPLFLEFIQHHLLLGVDHIFLSANFHWGSRRMKTLLRLFRTYISEGSVTMASQAGDNVDYMASVYGIYWNRNVLKLMQINMCLYLSKGVADYVGVWDLDEFFIPRLPYNNMIDVIRSMESPVPISYPDMNGVFSSTSRTWKGGRGLADGDGHPFCYISLLSQVLLKHIGPGNVDDRSWLGERFPHGPEDSNRLIAKKMGFRKSLFPTRIIFQAGLHNGGACKLPGRWSGCDSMTHMSTENVREFCFLSPTMKVSRDTGDQRFRFFNNQYFDENVWDRDFKSADPSTEAVIYHYLPIHRAGNSTNNWRVSPDALGRANEYVERFFRKVMEELERRDVVKYVGPPYRYEASTRVPTLGEIGSINGSSFAQQVYEISDKVVSIKEDIFLGAVIERSFDSTQLVAVIFLLRRPEVRSFAIRYDKDGRREGYLALYCDIRHSQSRPSSESYVVEGFFIPNLQDRDSGSNHRLDILRCPMQGTFKEYEELIRLNDTVVIEIKREGKSLAVFSMPWRSRMAGLMHTIAAGASRFDSWRGYGTTMAPAEVNLCVSDVDLHPIDANIPLLLEFVQYHLMLGVNHIFMAVKFEYQSPEMNEYIRILDKYIADGYLSIASQVEVSSFATLDVPAIVLKGRSIHENVCLYLSKGTAIYVGMWDINTFLIPKPGFYTVAEVVSYTQSSVNKAQTFSHPCCYVMFPIKEVYMTKYWTDKDSVSPSIGYLYANVSNDIISPLLYARGSEGAIVPTSTMYQMGLHMSGGCKLDWEYTVCKNELNSVQSHFNDSFCYLNSVKSDLTADKYKYHEFDSVMVAEDVCRQAPRESTAFYYKFLSSFIPSNQIDAYTKPNEYRMRYSKAVYEKLFQRGYFQKQLQSGIYLSIIIRESTLTLYF